MNSVRFPKWLKRKIAFEGRQGEVAGHLSACGLSTVCAEAKCPNRGECYSRGTATFLILGRTCTRGCAFCGVTHGVPMAVDIDEGERLAEAASRMGLQHVVITSVTRDDLPDGGASVFADVVRRLRDKISDVSIEVLIPDFLGSKDSLMTVLKSGPNVLNHNIETVQSLYPQIRPQAIYDRSLELIKRASDDGRAVVKSGMMVGLGESSSEVYELMRDLRAAGCQVITIGQYLRPSSRQTSVKEFVTPEQFALYEKTAINIGFSKVFCGPYVRSSYRADELTTYISAAQPPPRAPLI